MSVHSAQNGTVQNKSIFGKLERMPVFHFANRELPQGSVRDGHKTHSKPLTSTKCHSHVRHHCIDLWQSLCGKYLRTFLSSTALQGHHQEFINVTNRPCISLPVQSSKSVQMYYWTSKINICFILIILEVCHIHFPNVTHRAPWSCRYAENTNCKTHHWKARDSKLMIVFITTF